MKGQAKQRILSVVKLVVVVGLLYYLIDSGRLHFASLSIFLDHPVVLLSACLHWVLFAIIFSFSRWFLLLRGMGLEITFWRTLHLQMIGLFFNTAMPGAVGGDLVKGVYVIRDHPEFSKTRVMMTVLLDRVIGMSGLFVVASMAILLDFSSVWGVTVLKPLVIAVLGTTLSLLTLGTLILGRFKDGKDPFASILEKSFPGARILKKIYDALCIYRGHPRTILFSLMLSVCLQGGGMLYFYIISTVLLGQPIEIASFAAVFSVGILLTALPLLPGGLGVGHVAFDRLFVMIGLTRGADVFNIYILGYLSLNLLGAIPYLMIRKKDDPAAMELAAASSNS